MRRAGGYVSCDIADEQELLIWLWIAQKELMNVLAPHQKLVCKSHTGAKITKHYESPPRQLRDHPDQSCDADTDWCA